MDITLTSLAGGGNPYHDELGKFTTGPGGMGVASTEALAAQSAVGIAAVEKLLDDAVRTADYVGVSSSQVQEWDDVPQGTKDEIKNKWVNEQYDNGIDVNTDDLDAEIVKDLRENNDDIGDETSDAVEASLANAFPDTEAALPFEADQPFVAHHILDPETLTYDDDEGDGAPLTDLDQLAFKDGTLLTEAEQQKVVKTWNDKYESAFDAARDEAFQSDSYFDQRNELESQAIQDQWYNLDDSEKMSLYHNGDYADQETSGLKPGLPSVWKTGVLPGEDASDEDYQRSGAIARRLTELRTEQLFQERGISSAPSADAETLIQNVWGDWKVSSSSPGSLAFQLAAAKELGGDHRLTDAEVRRVENTTSPSEMNRLQAYARAQWEVTQFVMAKAGQDQVQVYRGLMLPGKQIAATTQAEIKARDWYTAGEVSFKQLPHMRLLRAGAQSTTGTRAVANDWAGVGNRPENAQRVVLRINAPRTSVISIPIFGQNEQAEHETVLLGTKDKWAWDAWLNRAPDFKMSELRTNLLRALARATKKSLVIDLQALDRDQPHWMSRTDGTIAEIVARRQQFRTAGGTGSGNFGHAGRPGVVGGSAPGSLGGLFDRIAQPDGGFTYQPVTGTEPKEGFALSIYPQREQIADLQTLTLDQLVEYTHKNADLLTQPNNYFGAWHDPASHKIFFDVSRVVTSRDEAERLAREHAQLAYFDLAAGKSISTAVLKAAYERRQARSAPRRIHKGIGQTTHPGRSDSVVSPSHGPRTSARRFGQGQTPDRQLHALAQFNARLLLIAAARAQLRLGGR